MDLKLNKQVNKKDKLVHNIVSNIIILNYVQLKMLHF